MKEKNDAKMCLTIQKQSFDTRNTLKIIFNEKELWLPNWLSTYNNKLNDKVELYCQQPHLVQCISNNDKKHDLQV